jgi:hypothetical protein
MNFYIIQRYIYNYNVSPLLYQKGYLDAHSIRGSVKISVLKSSFDICLHVIGFIELCKSDIGKQKYVRD